MKNPSILIVSLLILLGLSGCIHEEIEKKEDCHLTIAFGVDRFYGFHPWSEFLNDQTSTINYNIFNCLVEFDETFKIIPALATSWNNPNNLTWRFNLRQGVKFHNGFNFTAQDVKYSIELIKDDTNHTLYTFLTMIQDIQIIDEFIVDIVTFEPHPILLNKLTNIPIISKNYYENTTTTSPVGTGPYRFSKYIQNTSMVLERFDGYWHTKPYFQTVTFQFIEEYEDRVTALLTEQVDIIDYVLPSGSVINLSQQEHIKILPFLAQVVNYLSFDFRENNSCCFKGEKNPFSDLRVRKALYHAINISEIIETALEGYAESASQFISPYIFGYNPAIERLPYDLEKARAYMKEAGYEQGFEVMLDTSSVGANKVLVAELIASQLSEINITVIPNILPSSDFYMKIMDHNSSFYLIGWRVDSGDAGEIFDNILRSINNDSGYGTANFGYYLHPEIDRITEEIFYNMDSEERLDLMQKGLALAMDDVACVPLYIYEGIAAVNVEISWQPRADVIIKLAEIS